MPDEPFDLKVTAFCYETQIMQVPVTEPEHTVAVEAIADEAIRLIFSSYESPHLRPPETGKGSAPTRLPAGEACGAAASDGDDTKDTQIVLLKPVQDLSQAARLLRTNATPGMLSDPNWPELCAQADRLSRALQSLKELTDL
jgi:hypothetical protein